MISEHDRGLLYGDGVFETIRCRGAKLVLWQLHRERLLKSCESLAIPLMPDELDDRVTAALAEDCAPDCILKIIVTRGEGGRGYTPPTMSAPTIITQWHPLPRVSENIFQAGISCFYCDHPLSVNPRTAGIKHLNRLDQVLASIQLARAADTEPEIKEGLMCDVDGFVIEGTRTNLFAAIDGRLYTPDLTRAGIAGVMRRFLMQQLLQAGVSVGERRITRSDLTLASELFVCNSVFGIWPVARIQSVGDGTAVTDVEYSSRYFADLANVSVQAILNA